MKVKLTLTANEDDLALLRRAKGNLSLPAFLLRCCLKTIAQEEQLAPYPPDTDERNKACLLRCLQNGCASVEDIESVIWSLSQSEIESYLAQMEQEGTVYRQRTKRGRMWRWMVGPEPIEKERSA